MLNPLLGSELIRGLGAEPCLEKKNENFPEGLHLLQQAGRVVGLVREGRVLRHH